MCINHRTQTQQTRQCNKFFKMYFPLFLYGYLWETVDATERRGGGPQPWITQATMFIGRFWL